MIQKKKNRNAINRSNSISYYLPIVFIIIIIPLISHGKIIELSIEEANFWKGGTIHIDFFNYYKSIAFSFSTVALLLSYSGLILNNKLPLKKEKKYYISMLIYAVAVLSSTIFAHNRHVAIFGFISMHQGVFVVVSYIVILFVLINYMRDEADIKIIINSFIIITIAEGLLGLGQYFGFDFFKTQLGQWILSPSILRGQELGFIFGKHTIYGTLYNTNFVGSFGALVLPLSLILYLWERDRNKSIIYGCVVFLSFTTWLGCNSRAGYLGIAAASVVGIIAFRKIIKKQYKKISVLLTGFILIALIFNVASTGRVFNQFSRLNPVTEVKRIESVKEQQSIRFEEVSMKENTFTIKTNKETLIGITQDYVLSFKDENENRLDVNTDEEGKITFSDEKYAGYNFTIYEDEPAYIEADIYGKRLGLYVTEDKDFKVISFNDKLADPIEAPHVKLFDGKETFASNRGYIWSRTIPMLKDTLLIGYGPDNYPMVFPQEDYVGRFNVENSGVLDIIIDKPHNMYLQTAINTGVISLLALLAIWGIYLFDSFKLYINGNMESYTEYIGAAIFLSITAYLVAGLFNDSIISVAPLFWILLGTGIGINGMLKSTKDIN